MKRILFAATAGAAALAGSVALAAPAMASNGVTAVTHSAQHNDTTNVPVYTGSDVWALDNLSEHFTVTPEGATRYSVTIGVTGSFQGFADPTTGAALTSSGPVKGTITYDVNSTTPPDPKSLPAQEPDGTGLGVALNQLFGVTDGSSMFYNAASLPQLVGGGDYAFSYQNGNYTQVGGNSGVTTAGDVTGH